MKPDKSYIEAKRAFLAGTKCARCQRDSWLDVHHTAGRNGPLKMDQSKWIALCRECHDWLDRNRAEARARGWIAPIGQWNSTPRTKNRLRPEAG